MSEWSIIHGSCVSTVAFAAHRCHLSCPLDQNSLKTREVPFDSQLGNMRHLGEYNVPWTAFSVRHHADGA